MSKPVICIGASFVDELFHLNEAFLPATTNRATVTKTAGGVGRNIAHQLALLDIPVELISVFGNDSDGEWLKRIGRDAGINLRASMTIEGPQGKYIGIISKDGSLHSAFLSGPANHLVTPAYLEKQVSLLNEASWLVVETNISRDAISWLVDFSVRSGIPLIVEPVSVPPARNLREADLDGLYLITPNEDELPALCSISASTEQEQADELLNRGVQHIWLHNGEHGSKFFSKEKTLFLPAPAIDVVDSTGAGDAALSGFIFGKLMGKENTGCLELAHTLAVETLQVKGAIASHIDRQKLLSLVSQYYPNHE